MIVAAGTRDGRCDDHRPARDRARGTRIDRGYDRAHELERLAWEPLVEAGLVDCRRCGRRLRPTEQWDLGHPDAECPKPKAPECIPCNRATAGRIPRR